MKIPKLHLSLGLKDRHINFLKGRKGRVTYKVTKTVRIPGRMMPVGTKGEKVWVGGFEQQVDIEIELFKQKGRRR